MTATRSINWTKVRSDFPILGSLVNGLPLTYLDSGASSQKPKSVIDRLDRYWTTENANVHRGVHRLSQVATNAYEEARTKVKIFLNAANEKEVIFTKGCTEAINLVAASLELKGHFKSGDTILVSTMEHHSNIVPWQLAAARSGATVIPIPITDEGEIDFDAYRSLLGNHTVKLVAITHVSNTLGTINPIKDLIRQAHEQDALVMIDGAQAGPHLLIDVQDLDADFYALSCHKMYAPTGIGVLYGKRALFETMPPYQGGGDMIRTVSFEKTTYAELPAKFEAGTPNIAGAIGLGAAIDYLADLNPQSQDLRTNLASSLIAIHEREVQLGHIATEKLLALGGISIQGQSKQKAGIISFTMAEAHPHDIGTILDSEGVAIRTGHHCCMPLMKRLGVPATARASIALYNDENDINGLIRGVMKVKEMFA